MIDLWDTVPGGGLMISSLSTVSAALIALFVTRSAGWALIAGLVACWAMPIFGLMPMWGPLVCTAAVLLFVAGWRLFLRD